MMAGSLNQARERFIEMWVAEMAGRAGDLPLPAPTNVSQAPLELLSGAFRHSHLQKLIR